MTKPLKVIIEITPQGWTQQVVFEQGRIETKTFENRRGGAMSKDLDWYTREGVDPELAAALEEDMNGHGTMKALATINKFTPPNWEPLPPDSIPDTNVDDIEIEKQGKPVLSECKQLAQEIAKLPEFAERTDALLKIPNKEKRKLVADEVDELFRR